MSEIASIVYKPQSVEVDPPDHYARLPLSSARLVERAGIEGDRKGSHPERQLNIMSFETLAALAAKGLHTAPGEMGEQLVIRGLDVDALSAGSRLQIGAAACVEIIKPRTGCDRFQHIQGVTKESVAGQMGMIAKVVVSGMIRVGDRVTIVQPEHV